MITRCTNAKSNRWKYYGGRGVKVCERWLKYENFLADMGERPSSRHSIDRMDVDGNYEPGNCRWATAIEQGSNMRTTRMVTAFGVSLSISAWARRTGVKASTIRHRLNKGLKPEDAVSLRARP
jgi:hypothetical protein